MQPLTYPARPINGGHLDHALPKTGRWYYEPKYNGWRALIHTPTGTTWNRQGRPLTITAEFQPALALLKTFGIDWLDVEALERRHNIGRGTLIVLDAPAVEESYVGRRAFLRKTFSRGAVSITLPLLQPGERPNPDAVYLAPAFPPNFHLTLWRNLQTLNAQWSCEFYEGLVAKRAESLYPVQLNSPDHTTADWVKHRFIL